MNKHLVRTLILLGGSAFVITLCIGIFALYVRYAPDTEKQEYPDLIPQYTALEEDSINGLDLLYRVSLCLEKDQNYQEWLAAYHNDQQFSNSSEPLKILSKYKSEIGNALDYQMQCAFTDSLDDSHKEIISLTRISEFLTYDLKLSIFLQDQQSALSSVRHSLNLAAKGGKMQGNLLVTLCQQNLYSEAFENLIRYMEFWPISRSQQLEFASIIHKLPSSRSQLCNAINFEFIANRNLITKMSELNPPYLQKNKTIHLYATNLRKVKNYYQDGLSIKDFSISEKLVSHDDAQLWKTFLSDNGIGNFLVKSSMLLYGADEFKSYVPMGYLNKNTIPLLMALRCYQTDTGQLPSSLETLIPNYLKSIPLDPYSGSPMLYSKQNKRIWSIGSDRKNNGGLSKRADSRMSNNLDCLDEPHLNIPF